MRNLLLFFTLINGLVLKAQWQDLTPDTNFLHQRIYFNSTHKGTVIALNGVYMRTYNGGVTWDTNYIQLDNWSLCARTPYPSDLSSIYFPSDTIGYIGGQDGDFFKTTDGGLTWFCQGMIPTLDDVEDIYFFNNDTGVAATYYTIFRTTNGGASWTWQMPPLGPTRFERVNDSTVLAGGAEIHRSSDYGVTWVPTNHDSTIGFHDISMGDSLHGVAVAWAGKVITTSDGGLTWSAPSQISTVRISNVEMRNDSFGFITLGDNWENNWQQHDIGYVMYTLDGGQTWLQPDTIGTKTMTDLFMPSDSIAFVCGWLGNVMKNEHLVQPASSGTGVNEPAMERSPLVFPNPATHEI